VAILVFEEVIEICYICTLLDEILIRRSIGCTTMEESRLHKMHCRFVSSDYFAATLYR